ncbi:MAG: hypothetical protein E6K69_03890 [Nitrospirae bacterium]|nr:MAG: hypothetical protein E6K69_03890 [Nitrospirota bacterium]
MAKSKSHEHRRNRQKVALAVAEINQSIEQLRERVTQVEDMKKDGFPYRDALKARAEVQIRDTVRRIFGDKSPEFQEHRHHHIKTYPVTEIGKTLSILQGLIARLEQKKLDYLGVSQDRPDTVPTPQPSDSIASPAQRPQAPPSPPPATVIPGTPFVIYSTPPGTDWAPPPVTPPSPTTAAPVSATASPAPPVADPVRPVSSPPPPPPIAAKPGAPLTVRSTKSSTTDRYTSPSGQQARSGHGVVGSDRQRPDWSYATTPRIASESDALELVRKICTRFHAVARQLRLRREYRATLEVEDEYDVQDLFYALLRLEFDDIVTEDWMPSYTESANRTSFRLKREKIAIVVKKTRPGLGAREVADQLVIDCQRYSTHPDCTTLFCFVYDPEGRIGNPRGLEAELTSIGDERNIEVLVSPK